MRGAIFAITALMGLALGGDARAQDIPVWIWGLGDHSCAYWISNSVIENAENIGYGDFGVA